MATILTKLRKINDKKGTRISDVLNDLGGADVFTIRVVFGDGIKRPLVTVDKTSAEIIAALNAKKAIQAIYTTSDDAVYRIDMQGTIEDEVLRGAVFAPIGIGADRFRATSLEIDFTGESPEAQAATDIYMFSKN